MALPRELVPQPDGSLSVRLPEEFVKWHLENSSPLHLKGCKPLCGTCMVEEMGAVANSFNGVSVLRCEVPDDFFLSATILPQGEAVEFGFLLKMQDGKGHKLVVDKSKISLMRWASWGDIEPKVSRPISWSENEHLKVHLIVHGSIVEIFVGDRVSLACRIYDPPSGWLGLYSANGKVRFQDVTVSPLQPLV